jgi:DNA recombination protein RmuC
MEYIIVLLILVIGFLFYLIFNKKDNNSSNIDLAQFSNTITSQIQEIRKEVSDNAKEGRVEIEGKLKDINRQINDFHKTSSTNISEQFKNSNQVIKTINHELHEITATNKQVLAFSNQLRNLEKTFSNVKQRGNFGEIQLENLLQDYLPVGSYEMQYRFKTGEIVDAIIRAGENIIPIDSKFPLENYNRLLESTTPEDESKFELAFKNDVKKRIDETSKYVKPNEGTIDLAYMFVPAEGLYQDMLRSKTGSLKINEVDLIKYAFKKHVIISSPISLFAMLQIVIKGINNFKLEENLKSARNNVDKLSNHLKSYEAYHNKLGNTIGTVVSHWNNSSKEFKKIDKDILKVSSGDSKLDYDFNELNKPLLDD